MEEQQTTKTGRNDPCSCGSGKKYKKCCLNQIVKPKGYSRNDFDETEAINIFVSKINRERVRDHIRNEDKTPNNDGYIELLDNDKSPIATLFVQIKKIPEAQDYYDCNLNLLAYAEKSITSPFLLICVDTIKKVIFWEHIKRELFDNSQNQETKRIQLTKTVNALTDYYSEWKGIFDNYKTCIDLGKPQSMMRIRQDEEVGMLDALPTSPRSFQEQIKRFKAVNCGLNMEVRVSENEVRYEISNNGSKTPIKLGKLRTKNTGTNKMKELIESGEETIFEKDEFEWDLYIKHLASESVQYERLEIKPIIEEPIKSCLLRVINNEKIMEWKCQLQCIGRGRKTASFKIFADDLAAVFKLRIPYELKKSLGPQLNISLESKGKTIDVLQRSYEFISALANENNSTQLIFDKKPIIEWSYNAGEFIKQNESYFNLIYKTYMVLKQYDIKGKTLEDFGLEEWLPLHVLYASICKCKIEFDAKLSLTVSQSITETKARIAEASAKVRTCLGIMCSGEYVFLGKEINIGPHRLFVLEYEFDEVKSDEEKTVIKVKRIVCDFEEKTKEKTDE
ncbi:MAG: YecA family protein [bacterium]